MQVFGRAGVSQADCPDRRAGWTDKKDETFMQSVLGCRLQTTWYGFHGALTLVSRSFISEAGFLRGITQIFNSTESKNTL
jgi:hypothetical protein